MASEKPKFRLWVTVSLQILAIFTGSVGELGARSYFYWLKVHDSHD